MICTGNYKNMDIKGFKNVSISGDHGISVFYSGERYSKLAPKKDFWNIWHQNIGVIPEFENNMFYIEEYYKQVLAPLDIDKVYQELDDALLLCYEDCYEFCHRHIVAAWFELFLDIKVNELVKEGDTFVTIDCLKEIKKCLEKVIVSNIDMHNFNSLHALYLYQKGDRLVKEGQLIKKKAYDEELLYCKKYVIK